MPPSSRPTLIIVSGLSGSGKSVALRTLVVTVLPILVTVTSRQVEPSAPGGVVPVWDGNPVTCASGAVSPPKTE